MNWIHAALFAASVTGVILNIHHRKECFYIWFITNAGWVIVDAVHGIYLQSAQLAIYAALSLYGLAKWRRLEPDDAKNPKA